MRYHNTTYVLLYIVMICLFYLLRGFSIYHKQQGICSIELYYMAGSADGQDEANPVF